MNASTTTGVWDLLDAALTDHRSVAVIYNDQERIICPHALGWKNNTAKILAYQSAGFTSRGRIEHDHSPWRSLFIERIQHPVLADTPWSTDTTYSPHTDRNIDRLHRHIHSPDCHSGCLTDQPPQAVQV